MLKLNISLFLTLILGTSAQNDTVPFPFQVDANVKSQDAFDTRINLRKEPSVVNKLTLYRAITNPEEIDSTKDRIGSFPVYFSYSEGDFNAPATENLYFFDDDAPALAWCAQKRERKYEECAVATYVWDPPSFVSVKRFNIGTDEWLDFVTKNYGQPLKQDIQRWNDWIEGPLSAVGPNGGYIQHDWPDMQHALVNPAMNHHLTITEVNPIYCDVPRLSARQERYWCSDKNRHALALAKTSMFNYYDGDLIKKRGPPKPKEICPGHKFGIYNLGRDAGTGKVGYAVMSTDCKQATGTRTTNPCDDPMFSCSPPPIKLTQLHYNGQDYACDTVPNAGKCPGGINDMEFCCGDSASSS